MENRPWGLQELTTVIIMLSETGPTYRYRERLSEHARDGLARAESCIACDRGGWRCLNRSLRVLNFAIDCEADARRDGAFMIARLSHALFNLVRYSREWEAEHFSAIRALCGAIRHLADHRAAPAPSADTALVQDVLEDMEVWVSWLEDSAQKLQDRPQGDFDCLRRPHRRCDA